MKFECAKAENCFADSQTYEYRLPVAGREFLPCLTEWDVSENRKYRRPMFTADKGGVNIKGVLAGNVFRVSFPEKCWAAEKTDFEAWLGGLEAD